MTPLAITLSALAAAFSAKTSTQDMDFSRWQREYFDSFKSAPRASRVFDFRSRNEYCLLCDSNDFLLINADTGERIVGGCQDNNPYADQSLYHIYNPGDGPFRYLVSDGFYLWSPDVPEYKVSLNDRSNGVPSWDVNDPVKENELPSNAVRANNSEYFFRLKDWHGPNTNNQICTLISIQILAGYYDSFLNDSFIPEKWDHIPVEAITHPQSGYIAWLQSPGGGCCFNKRKPIQKADSRMTNYLVERCSSTLINPYVLWTGNTIFQQKSLVDDYLATFSDIPTCSLNWTEGNWNDAYSQATMNLIESSISAGRPVIANARHHSTVAFAYDDTYVYLHDGYKNVQRVPKYFFTEYDFDYSPTAIDFNPAGSHQHNNNFYSNHTDKFYCSCGREMSGSTTSLSDLVSTLYDTSAVQTASNVPMSYGTADIESKHAQIQLANNHIYLNGAAEDAYLQLVFSESVKGVMATLEPEFIGDDAPCYLVEYRDADGAWIQEFHLESITNLGFGMETEVALNVPKNATGLRIKVLNDNSFPKLRIKKLTFAFC